MVEPAAPSLVNGYRFDLAAFGATSRAPAQPSLMVAFEVCDRPAVGAASAISLGST